MTKIITNRICYIWGGKASTHKQGKVPTGVWLNIIALAEGRYELDPEHTKAVIELYDPDRMSDYDKYSSFWIDVLDVDQAPGPNPDPTPIPDPVAAQDDMELVEVVVTHKYLKKS